MDGLLDEMVSRSVSLLLICGRHHASRAMIHFSVGVGRKGHGKDDGGL